MEKLIQYMYFLGIGAVASGAYLVGVYILLGDRSRALRASADLALQLAVTLWFRKRYDLWP